MPRGKASKALRWMKKHGNESHDKLFKTKIADPAWFGSFIGCVNKDGTTKEMLQPHISR